MKMPITWHEECLKNRLISLERSKQELARKEQQVQRETAACRFTERQIEEAKNQKKDGFDDGRFLITTKGSQP
jgi:hypothetical protein